MSKQHCKKGQEVAKDILFEEVLQLLGFKYLLKALNPATHAIISVERDTVLRGVMII